MVTFIWFDWVLLCPLLGMSLILTYLYRGKALAAQKSIRQFEQEARLREHVDICIATTIEQCVQCYITCAQQYLRFNITGTEAALELTRFNNLVQTLHHIAGEKKTALTCCDFKEGITEQEIARLIAKSELSRLLVSCTEQAQWELCRREQLRQQRHSREVDPFTSKVQAVTQKYEHRIKSSQLTQ